MIISGARPDRLAGSVRAGPTCWSTAASAATSADFPAVRQQPHWRLRRRRSRLARRQQHAPDRMRGSAIRGLLACDSGSKRASWICRATSRAPSAPRRAAPAASTAASRRTWRCRRASAPRPASSFLRERGDSSFITGASGDAVPIERSQTGLFAELRFADDERLFVTGGLRVEHLRAGRRSRPTRTSRRARPFPQQTVNSVQPEDRGQLPLPARRSVDAGARQRRHGHPSARRVRDRLHGQPEPQAGAQPQRRRRRRAARGGQARWSSARPRSSTRYDDLLVTVGHSLAQREPVQDRQHLERPRAGPRAVRGRRGREPVADVHANYTFLDDRASVGRRTRAHRAAAVQGRGSAVRRPGTRASIGVTYARRPRDGVREASRRERECSTSSRTSAPSEASSSRRDSPSSTPARVRARRAASRGVRRAC